MTDERSGKGPAEGELEIETPCPRTWDSLEGDERRRFCTECGLHVHNSAALTHGEVRELLDGARGRVCMRVVRDASGAPVYLESSGAGEPAPVRLLPRAAGWFLAAGAALMTACRDGAPAPGGPPSGGGTPIEQPDVAMGIVAPDLPELLGEVALPVGCDDGPPDAGCDDPGDGSAPGSDGELAGEDGEGAPPPEVLGRIALPVEPREIE